MRPAVHASILRNRGPRRHTRRKRHIFSAKRLLLMVFCGIILFIPGLVLTIVENSEGDIESMGETQRIVFQAVGPSMCTIGAIVMFASCIYFYCYGTGPQGSSSTPQQSMNEHDHDDKGSIRSKRDHHHHHHHHHQHNGRAVEVHSPDSECRRSLRGEEGANSPVTKAPHRTFPPTEEEVPLAKMEDSSDLVAKGQHLQVPVIMIHIQEPSDVEDLDFADDVSMGKQSISIAATE